MVLFASALASVLFVAAPVSGEDAPAPDKEAKICKVSKESGSRLARGKVCKTKAAWDAETQSARDKADQLNREKGTGGSID